MSDVLTIAAREFRPVARIGHVRHVSNLSITATGPVSRLGEVCDVRRARDQSIVEAEVVALQGADVTLMPLSDTEGIGVGDEVSATGSFPGIVVGSRLLGRVVDALGSPIDGLRMPLSGPRRSLSAAAPSPLTRPRITEVLETGIKAIDALLTIGKGQRVGIFAGSGVGKSTLLGMIARNVTADVNVIALIGERGREVREFVEKQLGTEGLRRSVVIVATSDQSPVLRSRAAYAATTIAEHFRDQGLHVLLTMDSITRFAMARREIGLAAGEPPTSRGYTPSLFSEIPRLCERCGTAQSGGSITALYTVLVEGDDFNEPVSDTLRATLDGHIVLSRDIAHEGTFPAIDVLQSASRLFNEIVDTDARQAAARVIEVLACYARNRTMIELGAYRHGSNAEIDRALRLFPAIKKFLTQPSGLTVDRTTALAMLLDSLDSVAGT